MRYLTGHPGISRGVEIPCCLMTMLFNATANDKVQIAKITENIKVGTTKGVVSTVAKAEVLSESNIVTFRFC